MEGPYYGFRSWNAFQDAYKRNHDLHTILYDKPDGTQVVVQWVDQDIKGAMYLWSDKECVGEVTEFVKKLTYEEAYIKWGESKN